jgi:tetratricopeptide (TPR) repeat protein
MPRWPWKRKADPQSDPPPAVGLAVAINSIGDRSVAAHTIQGDVYTGDVRPVELAPGVVQPPDDIGVPTAGAHNLPRRPNPIFVGRDELLAQVATLFTSAAGAVGGGSTSAAIIGFGGVGKSELALHYAAGRTGPSAVVWWADAGNAQTLELALADLAYRLQPMAKTEEWKTIEAADWAAAWLQAHTGWLLILDNVDDPAVITPLLGTLTTGDILITTRRDITWTDYGATPVTLDLLSRPASVELLRERSVTPAAAAGNAKLSDTATGFDAEAADALAAALGDLPLALQQAAAYVAANRLPIAAYLQRLQTQTGAILGKTAPGTDPHRAVARVFALTIDALQTAPPAAVDILDALAWLAPVPLPRQVITQSAGADTQGAGAATTDVDEVLGLVASYSLINLTATTVAVHRLLQACLRDHDRATSPDGETPQEGLTEGQATALKWLSNAIPTDPDLNVTGWGLWRDLLPHLDAFFDHLPQEPPDTDLASLLGQTGFYLWLQGRHRHALDLEERALAITEAALGPDHPDTGLRLANLAATLVNLGRPADALPLQQRALTITEAALGPDHPDTATRSDNLAGILIELGWHAEALPLQQRALAITEAALGPDQPDTATRLNNLAGTLIELGWHADALPLQQRALTITEAALGPDHPTTGLRLDNLAHTLIALDRHDEALPLQKRAVRIAEAALPADHPDTAYRLHNLAFTLGRMGRHTEALPLQQRALAIAETALGPEHPDTATLLENLAATLDLLGCHMDATAVREGLPAAIRSADDRSSGSSGP